MLYCGYLDQGLKLILVQKQTNNFLFSNSIFAWCSTQLFTTTYFHGKSLSRHKDLELELASVLMEHFLWGGINIWVIALFCFWNIRTSKNHLNLHFFFFFNFCTKSIHIIKFHNNFRYHHVDSLWIIKKSISIIISFIILLVPNINKNTHTREKCLPVLLFRVLALKVTVSTAQISPLHHHIWMRMCTL